MAIPQRTVCAHLLLGVVALVAATLTVVGCSRTVAGTPVADSAIAPRPAANSAQFPPSGPLTPGDCVSLADFTVAGCTRPHELEVFRFDLLPADLQTTYPVPASLLPRVEPQCRSALPEYLGSTDVDASRLREFVYWPSRQGWQSGERWVLCAVVEIGPDDRPLRRVGALRGALRGGLGEFQACAAGPPSQSTLRVVRCGEPHRGEAIPGVLLLGAPTDPPVTAAEANEVAEQHCRRTIDDFLGAPGGQPDVRYSWRYPLAESWPNGYTSVVCYAETDTPVVGSLRDR